jgi:hypothetical protein
MTAKRAGLWAVVLAAVVGVIGQVCLPFGVTHSAFEDAEYATIGITVSAPKAAVTATGRNNYLGATMIGLSPSGSAAYVWGHRGDGLSGQGVQSVASGADVSVVKLPGDRKILQITGGSSMGNSSGALAAIGVLADDGSVWTWGVNDGNRLGRPTSAANNSKPGRVPFPDDAKIVDLQAGSIFFAALSDKGDLYTFGSLRQAPPPPEKYGVVFSELGQGSMAWAREPRLILKGIHSFGVSIFSAWAIAAPNWTRIGYAPGENKAKKSEDTFSTAGVVFWGLNDELRSGAGSGDPTLVNNSYATPQLLSPGAKLNEVLAAGTKAGDQNGLPAVAMGSPADKGTFQRLTGNQYSNQAILRTGVGLTWGTSLQYSAGNASGMSKRADLIPTPVQLGGRKVVAVANSMRLAFLLDDTGTAWIYGHAGPGDGPVYPDANGQPGMKPTNVPVKIDAPTTSGWGAGGITGITGGGSMSIMFTRADGSVWVVGGSMLEGRKNAEAIVRTHWTQAQNKAPTDKHQPATLMDFTGLPS